VKYKVIPAAAHNFTHSFVSLMNYVDDQYVIDILREIAADAPGNTVSIEWLPDPPVASVPLPPTVQKSVGYYRARLAEHLQSHGVPMTALRSFQTVLWHTPLGLRARAEAVDDRGKHHTKQVNI
jgi:uncharacterized protein CbrC (UPF0167 family)